jgi:hypothetical protein
MRTFASLLCLVLVLALTTPSSHAQLRSTSASDSVPTRLYDTGEAAVDALSQLFGAQHFRMAHSYEASFSSFGGQNASLGMYTNSMMWQFNQEWAARVDVGVAHSLGGTNALGQERAQVFLRNAEVAYRPSENMQFRLQIQQSPYGRYMSPYGRYGAGNRYSPMPTRTTPNDLFWKN